jgi:hypothetical protein
MNGEDIDKVKPVSFLILGGKGYFKVNKEVGQNQFVEDFIPADMDSEAGYYNRSVLGTPLDMAIEEW